MNEYSPKTWQALKIFAVIFVLIKSEFVIACSDKSSKFNSFACTLVVRRGFKIFMSLVVQTFHWWMKSIYFASFYFRVFSSIREIRENKNLAKISTYTVDFTVTEIHETGSCFCWQCSGISSHLQTVVFANPIQAFTCKPSLHLEPHVHMHRSTFSCKDIFVIITFWTIGGVFSFLKPKVNSCGTLLHVKNYFCMFLISGFISINLWE